MTLSRAEKSVLTDWWFTVDRMLLASILAIAGAGVVLSPACASFDHYRNFEVRGDAFRALVEALPGFETRRGPA